LAAGQIADLILDALRYYICSDAGEIFGKVSPKRAGMINKTRGNCSSRPEIGKADVSSMNACAGLSRRRQVNLKKINLGIDGPLRLK
jgi:hypothetical protein